VAEGGVGTPLTAQTRATLEDLIRTGQGDLDIAALVAYLATRDGVQLTPSADGFPAEEQRWWIRAL
jgi:hypothetical protein